MSSSSSPSQPAASPARGNLPLTGADCFLRAFDHEVRRMNGASHASQLVLRLGPGFDKEAFQHQLRAAVAANPILHAPIRRRAGLGPPAYRTAAARPETAPQLHVHASGSRREQLPETLQNQMNQPFSGRRGQLLRFDLFPYDEGRGGYDLAMTWLHLLFDGTGSEVFLRWLQACHRGTGRPDELPPDDASVAPGMPPALRAGERGQRAKAWQQMMAEVAKPPARSLAGPLRRTPQALRYSVTQLGGEEFLAVTQRAKEKAGFLTPMLYYLAAALRAHHAVFRARGIDPQSYVVPLPVNMRPKGSTRAIFRTRVSLLWFRVLPEQLGDFDGLVAELKQQRRQAIQAGHVENGIIAMDYARSAPMRVYTHMARRSMHGELCSFFFAWTGEFAAGLSDFFGAAVQDGFHAPAVPPSPGSVLALSSFRGHLNATHVHQRGVFDEREQGLLREQLLHDLLGRELDEVADGAA